MPSSSIEIGGVEDAIATDRLRSTALAFEYRAQADEIRNILATYNHQEQSRYYGRAIINLATVVPVISEVVRDTRLRFYARKYEQKSTALMPPEQ